MTPRRHALCGFAAFACLARPTAARSQEAAFPTRPINVVLPLAAGSASDAAVRILADRMEAPLGQRVTVENVPGAAGALGAERAARARPDGYALAALNNSILTILPNVQGRAGFDPFGDFLPIMGIANIPTYLGVHAPSVRAGTVQELIAEARSRPGELNYASGGAGSPQHLATEMFMALADAPMTHVPYRGATQAAADLAAGHVQVMFISHSLLLPFVDSGRIRLLGFAGPRRSKAFPEIPTVAEQGVADYDYSSWIALFAPKGTPEAALRRLRAEAARAMEDAAVLERLEKAGLEPWPTPPELLPDVIRTDYARWQRVVRTARITAN